MWGLAGDRASPGIGAAGGTYLPVDLRIGTLRAHPTAMSEFTTALCEVAIEPMIVA
jgi:hypothetical protein